MFIYTGKDRTKCFTFMVHSKFFCHFYASCQEKLHAKALVNNEEKERMFEAPKTQEPLHVFPFFNMTFPII